MKEKLSIAFLLLLLIVSSCEKKGSDNEETPNGTTDYNSEIQASPGTLIFDENITKYFIKVTEDEILVSNSIPKESLPKEGNIICCSITETTPNGIFGRVVDISSSSDGYHLKLGTTSLEDAFTTLVIKDTIDLSQYVESITDSLGNALDFSIVNSSIMDEISANPDKDDQGNENNDDNNEKNKLNVESKAKASHGNSIALEIKNNNLSGNIFLEYNLNVNIELRNGTIEVCDFNIEKKTGISGTISLASKEGEKKSEIISVSIPLSSIPIGPLVLRPRLRCGIDLVTEGEVAVTSGFQYMIEHTKYTLDYQGTEWKGGAVDASEEGENYFKLSDISINGGFGFESSVGMRIALFTEKLLSVEFNIAAKHMANATASFSIKSPFATEFSPCLSFSRSVIANFSCWAKLFRKDFSKYEAEVTLSEGVKQEIPIIPSFQRLSASLNDNIINTSLDYDKRSILSTEDDGVALFEGDNEEAMDHNSLRGENSTKSASRRFDFHINDDSQDYYIAPYILHQGAYYYGEKIKATKDIRGLLIQLYNDTDGDNWINNDNWCSDEPIENWFGVMKTYDENNPGLELYELMLENNNLTGYINLSDCDQIFRLHLYSNNLKSLNVSMLTALKEIWCDDNQLTALDLSGCSSLETLWYNQLTALDLSGCSSLETLWCENNQLTALDLSGLSSLESIECNDNPLTTLNLSNCASLKELHIHAYHNDNEIPTLSSLDVSGCSSLEILWCDDNQLTALDLSGCKALKDN